MYTYKLHKSNATPVLSSRAHLGAHKRAAPFRSMFSCKGEEGNIGMLVWGGKGARGGGGGEGGEGVGGGGRGREGAGGASAGAEANYYFRVRAIVSGFGLQFLPFGQLFSGSDYVFRHLSF